MAAKSSTLIINARAVARGVVICVAAVVFLGGASFCSAQSPQGIPAAADVGNLIESLGSSDYYVRERATRQLEQLGESAFDALAVAQEHSDPEVAARSRKLTQKIPLDLARPEDPKRVKDCLVDYVQQPPAAREHTATLLAELPLNLGVSALARLARYERSPVLARAAALKLVRDVAVNSADWNEQRQLVSAELGESQRMPVLWLREHLQTPMDTNDAEEIARVGQRWRELAAEELNTVRSNSAIADSSDPTDAIWLGLYEHSGCQFARAADQQPQYRQQLVAVTSEMISSADDSVPTLLRLMRWIQQHELRESLGEFHQRFERPLESHPLLACVYAIRMDALHSEEAAKSAWAKAKDVRQFTPKELGYYPQESDLPVIYLAYRMEKEGGGTAARKEYRQLLNEVPPGEFEALQARMLLAESLADAGELGDAAQIMTEAAEAMWNNERRGRSVWGADGPTPEEMQSRAEFFSALAVKGEDEVKYMDMLQKSMFTDESNPDGMIELYHREENTPQESAALRRRILHALQILEQQSLVDASDDNAHNLYAWLAAKTFGDLDQAIDHSMESLRLNPSSASYFDTLAACFAAKENYVEAVRAQSRAASLDPFSSKLRVRLTRYRKLLEESNANGGDDLP